ncbi:MAG: hypothetical protein HY319_29470 [Armatimonadetes bacterium]|nr:hypothetical protein [Armatimonadota bacterium]
MERRGFTIPEMLVVCFLAIIVLFLIVGLLFPSFSMFRTQSAASDAQQSALLFMHEMNTGLLNTLLETVTIGSDPIAISYQVVQEANSFSAADGSPLMSDTFVVVHYDSGRRMVLMEDCEVPPGDESQPRRLSVAELQSVISEVSGEERVLARHVEDLKITDHDEDLALLNPPVRLTITCTVDISAGGAIKEERYQMTTLVTPRSVRY